MSDTAFGSRNVYGMLFETGARGWGYLSGNASTTSVDSVTTGQVDEAGGEVAIDVRCKREDVRWIKKHVD